MAHVKTSKKKPARKTTASRKKLVSVDKPLPPKARAKVLKKLKKLSLPPSHPSEITGPALTLGYEAPLSSSKRKSVKKTGRAAKKRTRRPARKA